MGVWGAIANKMEASQETCILGKNNPSLPPDYQRYIPKRKASIQSYLNFLKAYVEKLQRNDIDILGSGGGGGRGGGDSHQEASDISKNQIKWKPYIYSFFTLWQCSLNPLKYGLDTQLP